jgi:hypothetical protein
MKKLVNEYRNFINTHLRLLIFNVIITMVVFGIHCISVTTFIDTDTVLTNQGSTLDWVQIGRWGSVLLQKILHLSDYNPYVSMGLGFVFIILFLMTFCFFFYEVSGGKEYPFWVFCLLFLTHPIFACQWFFQLQNAEVSFSIFLIAVSLILVFRWIKEGKIGCLVPALVFMPIAFTTYETNYALYICGALFGFLLLPEIKKGRAGWSICLKLILTYAAAALVGYGISRIGLDRAYNDAYQTFLWGKSPAEALEHLGRYFKMMLTGSNYIYGHTYQLLLAAGILYLIFCRDTVREHLKKGGVLRILAVIVFLISAFLLPLVQGQAPTYRHQYTLSFVVGAGVMAVVQAFREQASVRDAEKTKSLYRKTGEVFGILLVLAVLAVSITQTEVTLRLWYTDRIRYEQDSAMLNGIMDDMHEAGISENGQSIIYVGKWEAPLNAACAKNEDAIGVSYFAYFAKAPYLLSSDGLRKLALIQGYNVKSVTIDQAQAANEMAKKMPCWPDKGYISQGNGFVVVKLSGEE